jgi:DNA-binding transcriptional MerR regulator
MRPTVLSRLLNVSGQTLRRWTHDYAPFLSAGATPPKGRPRALSEHDVRVLTLVATLRNAGHEPDKIVERLEEEQAQNWAGLPDIPSEWAIVGDTMPVAVAAAKAYDVAQITILQRDLEHAQRQLEVAQQRVVELEAENENLRTAQTATQAEFQQQLHAAQLELSQARGQVATLQARLSAYAITGGDKPVPVALIVAVTAVAAVVVVVLVFVVARLLL